MVDVQGDLGESPRIDFRVLADFFSLAIAFRPSMGLACASLLRRLLLPRVTVERCATRQARPRPSVITATPLQHRLHRPRYRGDRRFDRPHHQAGESRNGRSKLPRVLPWHQLATNRNRE